MNSPPLNSSKKNRKKKKKKSKSSAGANVDAGLEKVTIIIVVKTENG